MRGNLQGAGWIDAAALLEHGVSAPSEFIDFGRKTESGRGVMTIGATGGEVIETLQGHARRPFA